MVKTKLFAIALLALVCAGVGLGQKLSKSDSALVGKRAYIRCSYTKGTTYYEFVDATGKVVNKIKRNETIKKAKLSWSKDWEGKPEEVTVEQSEYILNKTKDRLGINIIKANIKDAKFAEKTGYFGMEKVDVAIYNEKGAMIFERKGVPYQIVKIADSGDVFCCIIPQPLSEADNQEYIPSVPARALDDDSLKVKGKIMVMNTNGETLFENYYYTPQGVPDIAFSPNGEWFAYTLMYYGYGWLANLKTKERCEIPRYEGKIHKYLKSLNILTAIGFNSLEIISNEGKLQIYCGALTGKETYYIYYDVLSDKIELGPSWRLTDE